MTYTEHPRELEALRQTVDWRVIRDAYAGAYKGVFGRSIDSGSLAVLLAHSALETGRWKAGLWNWNLGNIKASPSYIAGANHFHQYYRLNELLKQPDGSMRYEWFDPTHPQTRMRAYRTSADGASEKVRFLGTASNPAKGNRYQRAWDALEDDDAASFVRELKAAGYFTARLEPYLKAVVSLDREFRGLLDAEPYRDLEAPSAPLDAHDYDHSMPLHSATTADDLGRVWADQDIPWITEVDDETRDAIARDKRLAIAAMFEEAA